MIIKTKYNYGDKVWYYIPHLNKYTWGMVQTIETHTDTMTDEIVYQIHNRFYEKENIYDLTHCLHDFAERKWKQVYIGFEEKEVFASVEDLIADLEKKHKEKMSDLSELKENKIFGLL